MKGITVKIRIEKETVDDLIIAYLKKRFPSENGFEIVPAIGRSGEGGPMFVKHYDIELPSEEGNSAKEKHND